MENSVRKTISLGQHVEIPTIGLGVYRSKSGEETREAVLHALKIGYRHIDTAMIYGNEASVGEAIRTSEVGREAIFVTSKLWNDNHGYQRTLKACERSLSRLGLDYLDLYLVHWPVEQLRLETWRAMEALLASGKARTIGVSNYMVRHLQELRDNGFSLPAVNQIELSPFNYHFLADVVEYCRHNGIVVEAYSPLTKGQKLNHPQLQLIAEKYQRSTAQILIRWSLQKGFVVLPKSVRPQRIKENFEVFDFQLSPDDMTLLDGLNENLITGWDPTGAP